MVVCERHIQLKSYIPHQRLTYVPSGYVLINCDNGSQQPVAKTVSQMSGVKQVERVDGVYDIIASMEFDSLEATKDAITWKIKRLPHVRSTTLVLVNEPKG